MRSKNRWWIMSRAAKSCACVCVRGVYVPFDSKRVTLLHPFSQQPCLGCSSCHEPWPNHRLPQPSHLVDRLRAVAPYWSPVVYETAALLLYLFLLLFFWFFCPIAWYLVSLLACCKALCFSVCTGAGNCLVHWISSTDLLLISGLLGGKRFKQAIYHLCWCSLVGDGKST